VYESPGVQPVFLNEGDAIDYAIVRASFRSGEIRILDSSGAIERIIAFNESERRLWLDVDPTPWDQKNRECSTHVLEETRSPSWRPGL